MAKTFELVGNTSKLQPTVTTKKKFYNFDARPIFALKPPRKPRVWFRVWRAGLTKKSWPIYWTTSRPRGVSSTRQTRTWSGRKSYTVSVHRRKYCRITKRSCFGGIPTTDIFERKAGFTAPEKIVSNCKKVLLSSLPPKLIPNGQANF
jgi:hypothetical protein